MKIKALKKKLITLSVAAIIAAGTAYTSLAYYTADGTAQNVITAGNIKIELVEMMTSDDGAITLPFEDQIGVVPGCDVSKIVCIKNTGRHSAYIRVDVDTTISLAEGMSGDIDTSLVSFYINSEHWTKVGEYYYYNDPLEPNALSEPLFTSVNFSGKMSNMYQDGTAYITVNAYATQVENNGSSVFDAAGWPEA